MILDLIIFFGFLVADVVSIVGFVMRKQEGKPSDWFYLNLEFLVLFNYDLFFFSTVT